MNESCRNYKANTQHSDECANCGLSIERHTVYTITTYDQPGIGHQTTVYSLDALRTAIFVAMATDKPFLVGHQFHTELNVATRKTGGR
jgi:hypothetical protein